MQALASLSCYIFFPQHFSRLREGLVMNGVVRFHLYTERLQSISPVSHKGLLALISGSSCRFAHMTLKVSGYNNLNPSETLRGRSCKSAWCEFGAAPALSAGSRGPCQPEHLAGSWLTPCINPYALYINQLGAARPVKPELQYPNPNCSAWFLLTEIIDQNPSDHGPASPAQAQVEALQDPLGRGAQLRGHGGAQVRNAGCPYGRVRDTCRGDTVVRTGPVACPAADKKTPSPPVLVEYRPSHVPRSHVQVSPLYGFWKPLSCRFRVINTFFSTLEQRSGERSDAQRAGAGCRWSPRLWAPAQWLSGSGEEGTGKGWAEKKLEKQSSLGARHTSSTPELFCHPQTEWEYLFLFEWC